jgi:N-acetylmuramoyl-L-alanine amidase
MTRIFLSAGHGGFENGARDPGIIAGGTTEAQEIIRIRDLVVSELRSRDLQVITVPDDLSQTQTIDWINTHSRLGDMALELQTGGSSNPLIRGATAFYIAGNQARKKRCRIPIIISVTTSSSTSESRGKTRHRNRVRKFNFLPLDCNSFYLY